MDEPSASVAIEYQNICRQQQQQQHHHHRQQFASAPASLAPTLRGRGTPDLIPPTSVGDKRGSTSGSDRRARVGGGSSPLILNGRVGQPFLGPSCSSMAVGRRASSGGRRMPGMVRKSLQEQELRELLVRASRPPIATASTLSEAAEGEDGCGGTGPWSPSSPEEPTQASQQDDGELNRHPPCGVPREGRPSALDKDVKGVNDAVEGVNKGVVDAREDGPNGRGGGTTTSSSSSKSASVTTEEALSTVIAEEEALSNVITEEEALLTVTPEEQGLSNMRAEEEALSADASLLSDSPAAGGGGRRVGGHSAAAAADEHPVLELFRSIGEPLDQLSFEELKRKVSSAVEKDGAGPASMSELADFLGVLKRFNEDQLRRLKERYAPPGEAGGVDKGGEEVDQEGVGGGVVGEMGHGEPGGDEDEAESPDSVVDDEDCCDAAAGPPSSDAPAAPGSLSHVVLKFTTVADGSEAPSFAVGREGATVGRGADNDVCIPTDTCMTESDHASIVWKDGAFHVQDRGHPYGASIRIGTGRGRRDWPLEQGSMFSAGNSVFHTKEIDEERGILLEIVAGPLKGERRRVSRDGATVGRATENTITIADRELSRHHSVIECEDTRMSGDGDEGEGVRLGGTVPRDAHVSDDNHDDDSVSLTCGQSEDGGRLEFFLCDVGSTNGTYVQLVGPYASSRRLALSDHILIGRTGFSINRFDWGVWEDRGPRRTMEDKSVVIQDMGVESLAALGLGPQTFLAVYDGHGGGEASAYLWQHLHVAVAEALRENTGRISMALQQDREADRVASVRPAVVDVFGSVGSGGGGGEAIPCADRDDGGKGGRGGGWMQPAVFSSGSSGSGRGSGMPPLPPPPLVAPTGGAAGVAGPAVAASTSSRPALAGIFEAVGGGGGPVGGREGDASAAVMVEEESQPVVVARTSAGGGSGSGRKGLCWGHDPAAAKEAAAPSAPSLPQEWLFGARAMINAVRSGCGGGGGGSSAAPEEKRSKATAAATAAATATPAPPRKVEASASAQEWNFDEGGETGVVSLGAAAGEEGCGGGDAFPPAGGEEASAVRAESDDAGAVVAGSGAGGGGGARVDGGVVSPSAAFLGGRSETQSPGGEPSRSLATAGLPAEGGGYGSHKYVGGGGGGKGVGLEREKTTAALDRVLDDVVGTAFLNADEDFLSSASKPSCGSTATTAMILGDKFYMFNLGDSRTILCRSGEAHLVSQDHKPNREDETARIKKAGGMVIHKRVMGELAVSRAFGDRVFKMGIKALLREEEEPPEGNPTGDGNGGAATDKESGFDDNVGPGPEVPSPPPPEPTTTTEQMQQNRLTMDRGALAGGAAAAAEIAGGMGALACLPPPNALLPSAPTSSSPPAPPSSSVAVAAADAAAKVVAPAAAARVQRVPAPVTHPHEALITAQPEMLSCTITPQDEFVLLACDGLFDVFSSDEVVQIVREELKLHGDTQRVCETLTCKAINDRYTRDNVSVVLMVLNKFW